MWYRRKEKKNLVNGGRWILGNIEIQLRMKPILVFLSHFRQKLLQSFECLRMATWGVYNMSWHKCSLWSNHWASWSFLAFNYVASLWADMFLLLSMWQYFIIPKFTATSRANFHQIWPIQLGMELFCAALTSKTCGMNCLISPSTVQFRMLYKIHSHK